MAFGLTPWDPFRDLERLERTMRRTFDWPFGRVVEPIGTPAVELTDEGDHYLVKAEIPGVSEEDVDISLTGNLLTIRGEKRYERRAGGSSEGEKQQQEGQTEGGSKAIAERQEGALHRPLFSEVYYGSFERVLTLPDDIDPDRVEAEASNGVFSIRIGKQPQQRARKIEITRH